MIHRNKKSRVFICDGQGAVEPNMGKALYASNSRFKTCFDQISLICDQDITSFCWGKERFKLKSDPYLAHLALFAVEYALFQTLTEKEEYAPGFVTGHSLGEIFACIFSGALTLEDGANLVTRRGKLFLENIEACRSDMVNLSGEEQELGRFIEEMKGRIELYTCNFNNRRNTVVSLKKSDIPTLAAEAGSKKIRAVKLNLNNGCHSSFVEGINDELDKVIEGIEFQRPVFPLFSGSFSKELASPQEIKSHLKKHLLSPVYWEKSILTLIDMGYSDFIEVGVSKILKGILLGIDPQLNIQLAKNLV